MCVVSSTRSAEGRSLTKQPIQCGFLTFIGHCTLFTESNRAIYYQYISGASMFSGFFPPLLCPPPTIIKSSSGATETVRQPESAPARGDPSQEDHRGRGQAHLVFSGPGSSGVLPGVDSEPTQGSARGSPPARLAGLSLRFFKFCVAAIHVRFWVAWHRTVNTKGWGMICKDMRVTFTTKRWGQSFESVCRETCSATCPQWGFSAVCLSLTCSCLDRLFPCHA